MRHRVGVDGALKNFKQEVNDQMCGLKVILAKKHGRR